MHSVCSIIKQSLEVKNIGFISVISSNKNVNVIYFIVCISLCSIYFVPTDVLINDDSKTDRRTDILFKLALYINTRNYWVILLIFFLTLVPGTTQPPIYHGRQIDPSTPNPPLESRGQTRSNHVPPPYPNTPPPAYFSRMGTSQENRLHINRVANSRQASRISQSRATNSRMESRSDYSTGDIHPEVFSTPSVTTTIPPSRSSNSNSRYSINNHDGILAIDKLNSQQENHERTIITLEDLEAQEKDDEIDNIDIVKPESKMSVTYNLNQNDTDQISIRSNSRTSTKVQSRMSTKIMYPILENETPMIPSDKRGRFIKSSMSVVSEDIGRGESNSRMSSRRNHIRSVEPDENVNQLDFV